MSSELPAHELLKHLECCVCLEIRKGVLHTCPNDHLICARCHGNLTPRDLLRECPTCRTSYALPPKRNQILERMVADLDLDDDCPNTEAGCDFRGKDDR